MTQRAFHKTIVRHSLLRLTGKNKSFFVQNKVISRK